MISGIYRKSGGAGLSKNIRTLFERGDYEAFDLLDQDRYAFPPHLSRHTFDR